MSLSEPGEPGTALQETDATSHEAPLLDYATVSRYWSNARPSIMGPYMMDGFGFPASAGSYRFDAEREIVDRLIRSESVAFDGTVLDLGSGVGFWAEYFAQRFRKVVAIEASTPLFDAMKARCARYANATLLNADVLAFRPEGRYSMIFLGGMLMYLNEKDVISLLERLTTFLEPGGVVLCRESTVRKGTLTREGDYQVVYRSPETYSSLFARCGLSVGHVELNTPYFLMQMGCEFIKSWKATVPEAIQAVPLLGRLTYGVLRLGGTPLTRLPDVMGFNFPELTNHFFVLHKNAGGSPGSTSPS